MILFGWDSIDLGTVTERDCDLCEKERPFNLILNYKYFSLYWMFGCVTKREYTLGCLGCQRVWALDQDKLKEYLTLEKEPIPFMRRYGLLSFGIGFVLLILTLLAIG